MPELIAYFSRAGENYVNGNILNLSVGNTELAAKIIQEVTGADLFQRLFRMFGGGKRGSTQTGQTGVKKTISRYEKV